jgi:hypothetical protein
MTTDDGRAEWVDRWKAAAPKLAAIRAHELRHVDVAAFIEAMADAYAAARRAFPARSTSGLVIQQRTFAKLRQ